MQNSVEETVKEVPGLRGDNFPTQLSAPAGEAALLDLLFVNPVMWVMWWSVAVLGAAVIKW